MTETKKNANWLERVFATVDDERVSLHQGLMKGVEGVADAGMGAVGFIGGLFSDDFKNTMRKAIEFDATGYLLDQYNDNKYVSASVDFMTNPMTLVPNAIKLIKGDDGEGRLEEIERKSYLTGNKVGEFVKEATTSIGQMAPGLALSFVPGVGPTLSMAYTGVSAGGNSMEGALKEGAGYNNAFTYGILSGATEAAMEKLGGYAFGDATSLLGKATAGTKFGTWASKGLGKAITGAVSEGVEELGSDFADPVNKWITGVDTEIGANFREAVKNIPRTFAMGATVGGLMQGGQVLGQNISNKSAGRGGAKATRADSSLAYVSESAQNYGKNEAQNRKTDKAILQGLTDVGVQMTQMSESERAVYRESLGEYKNAFNEDGSIKQDLEIADVNTEAISRKLKPISLTLKHAPISSNEQISEGASQAKSHIEKVLGSKANVVITNSDSGTNAFYNPGENVFYINNNSATLNDADGAIKKASLQVSFHEMTHSAEGTRQYNEFVNELNRVAMDENAPDAIKKRVGSLFDRELGAIQDYAEQTKGMSKAQASYTFDTEVTADLAGDILADDYIVNKLAERNAPLVKKLISRFKGTIKKSATVDSESIKYLKKLVNRFEKALDNAQGGVKISQIGNDEEEREEKADSSQQIADSKSNRNKQPTQEDIEQGKKLVEFIKTVEQMQDKSIRSKRKHRIGLVSKEHAQFAETLLEEVGIDIDLDGYELWIDGTGTEHIEIRHGEQGKADSTMSDDALKEKIPWSVNFADSGEIIRDNKGEIEYSKRFFNSDGSRAPQIKMYKNIDKGMVCVSECVPDSKYRRIYITSTYIIKKGSKGQLLNMDENTSPQPTPKASFDSTATNISITEKGEKDNSFDENNSKKVSNERKSVKRSYEPEEESSKKITLGMSDAERTEILKDKKIQRIAEAQQFSQDVLEKIPEIHTWEDIDKYFGKQKRNLIQKIADEFKVFKNYENKDISLSFEFTNNNFRESYGKQKNKFVSFAKMFSVFDTVIENAVGIEVHKRPEYKPDPTLKNVYVLMSSFADGDYFIPVKLEIKEFNDKQNKLYVAIALDGIKKTEVSKQGTTEIGVAQGSRSVNISILDLMQKINPSNTNFTKYFPKNILTQAQKEILDSDTNNDERKSVKRSYEPGKESEFEEVLKSKYGSTSTDLSKYKKAKSSKASEKTFSQDEMLSLSMKLLKITSNRDKSNKKIVELTKALNQAKGDLKRYEKTITSLADELNSKKYSSNDVAMAMEALLSVDSPLGRSIELKDADYDAAVRKLKNDLNSKTDFNSKANAALELAKFIVKKGMVTEYTVDSNMQEAIEFLDDLKPLLDNESISTDDAIAKLNELGFDTSGFTSDNVFDVIKTMYDDAYAIVADNIISYRVSIYNTLNAKQAHELTQKIAKEILNSYEKVGEKTKLSEIVKKNTDKINGLKEDLKTAYERNKFENRILREISKMAEIQSGKYVNSTQAKPEVFSALQSLLKKLDSRGQLNRTSTRKILAKLAEWYIPENPMLKSFGAEGSENKNTGFFSQEMYEKIQYFVEDKGKERLSITELKEVNEILHHINYIFENYGKIWRGNRYVEALDVAKEYAKKLNIAEKDVPAFARVLLKNAITRKINDPMSVCASWDGYDEDGFFTQTYREFAEALIKQKHDEMTAFAELKEFERENKKYFKALINGKSKIKVMGRINVREGKVDTVEMPKYAAIDLYMTSRTGNAIDTFEQTGYKLKLDNEHVEEDFQPISREQIEAMYKEFSEQDKELIKILDKAYNGICRDLKYDCDMRRLGWSNVFEGIYYPLYRDHSVDFDKDDFNSVMSRVSNVSSNHTRVHSKNAIIVSNAITKFMRHVNDVTRYANLAIPVENLNILFNLDIGDNVRMPTSIRTQIKKSNFWKGAKEYLFNLSDDVQGVGKKLSSGKKLIAWLRGSYAKYQLGANPKVWFSQLSSYFASFGELRIGSLLKAFSLKDTYTNSDVDEYCKLAAVRSYERGASSAMAVSEKIGQAGSYLTKPIEFVDRRVVCALFSACQFEAQARYKLEVGTKANKVKAGEILTDVILKTQQNQLVTEQSAVMRDDSEIIRSFTMFSADQMKLNSRFTQSLGELATINKKLKDAKKANNQQLVEELTKKRNEAIKKTAKYSASIVTIAFYMAALAKAVQWFRRKDEDEPIGEWLFKEAGLNLLTTVPFFRDIVSFFTDGFEADIFAISMVNDVLNATEEMKNNFADMANGKEVTSEQWFATGRKAAYAIGQMAGFPVRNIYNVVTGWTRRIDQSAGATVDSWFKAPSDTDLKESYKEAKAKGNVSLAGKSLDLIYKNHDMDLTDAVLKKELDRLNGLDITKKDDDKSNYSVIAKRAPDTITFDGEEIELTAKQKNTFKTAYKSAEAEAGKMVRVYRYKKLDSASQAYAIRKIYEYQYSKAEESLTGERARLVYFGDIIGMDKLALILGYANSLKGDKDRKAKIEAYIKSMGLISQHASLALRFLGYSDKDNDSKVKNFIKARSSLTREQKEELLEMLKLD